MKDDNHNIQIFFHKVKQNKDSQNDAIGIYWVMCVGTM